MKKGDISVVVTCTLVAGLALTAYAFFSPSTRPAIQRETRQPSNATLHAPIATVDSLRAPFIESNGSAPAWLRGNSLPASEGKQRTESAAAEQRKRQLAAAVDDLQRLQKNENVDPLQVASALKKLETANGSPIFHGTRLDVLRQNLELSQKMRLLAAELDEASRSPTIPGASPTPEQQAQLKIKKDQLDALARQIRTDVTVDSTKSEIR